MIGIRDYLIEVVFNNIKDNIKIYSNNDNTEPLILLTEEILKEIKKLPLIYDLRDGY